MGKMATEMTMSEIQGLTTAKLRTALTSNLFYPGPITSANIRKIYEKRLYRIINGHEHGAPNQRRTRRQTLQARTTIGQLNPLSVAGNSARIHPNLNQRIPVPNARSSLLPNSNRPLQNVTNKSKQIPRNKTTKKTS